MRSNQHRPSDRDRKNEAATNTLNRKPSELARFQKLTAQFEQAHTDFVELARVQPSDSALPLQISFANRLIEAANRLLPSTHRPFATFEGFDNGVGVCNSDIMLLLGQYRCCLKRFGEERVRDAGYTLCWVSGAALAERQLAGVVACG